MLKKKRTQKYTIFSYELEKTAGNQNSSNQISRQLEVANKQQDFSRQD